MESPAYAGTLNLRVAVHAVGRMVVVENPTHPLAVDQREGVTFERLHELQHALDFEHVRTCPHHAH